MIPPANVTAWSRRAPWPTPAQVEQDLLLSRLLIEISNDPYLGQELVFRGGTCLHKLYLDPPRRYSEDLDYVRRTASGIGDVFDAIRAIGERIGFDRIKTTVAVAPKVTMRTTAADGTPLRVKVEMNTFERSPAQALVTAHHAVDSPWWRGTADVTTFTPAEIVASKIRALYQRSKGRDLFDLWLALTELTLAPEAILAAYPVYAPPGLTADEAVANVRVKLDTAAFRADLDGLVTQPPSGYDVRSAGQLVIDTLLSRLPRGS